MDWFRARRRSCAGLGLLALALQLVLGFGHHHGFQPKPLVAAAFVERALGDLQGAQLASHASQRLEASSGDNNGHRADDTLCSICIAVSAASSAVFTPAPDLPLPHAFAERLEFDVQRQDSRLLRPAIIRSRGPPDLLTALA